MSSKIKSNQYAEISQRRDYEKEEEFKDFPVRNFGSNFAPTKVSITGILVGIMIYFLIVLTRNYNHQL